MPIHKSGGQVTSTVFNTAPAYPTRISESPKIAILQAIECQHACVRACACPTLRFDPYENVPRWLQSKAAAGHGRMLPWIGGRRAAPGPAMYKRPAAHRRPQTRQRHLKQNTYCGFARRGAHNRPLQSGHKAVCQAGGNSGLGSSLSQRVLFSDGAQRLLCRRQVGMHASGNHLPHSQSRPIRPCMKSWNDCTSSSSGTVAWVGARAAHAWLGWCQHSAASMKCQAQQWLLAAMQWASCAGTARCERRLGGCRPPACPHLAGGPLGEQAAGDRLVQLLLLRNVLHQLVDELHHCDNGSQAGRGVSAGERPAGGWVSHLRLA